MMTRTLVTTRDALPPEVNGIQAAPCMDLPKVGEEVIVQSAESMAVVTTAHVSAVHIVERTFDIKIGITA